MRVPFCWVVLAFLATGCLPIPWHRTVMVRPAGVVRVIDGESGAPIAGAEVVVRRYNLGPPPRRETDRFAAVTTSAGEARFTAAARGEWVFPLMMHGVPQWVVDVCASAAGYAALSTTWVVQHAWSTPSVDTESVPRVELPLTPAPEGEPSRCFQDPGAFSFGRELAARLTYAAAPPVRPAAVPPSARWTWASEHWIDCRPRPGASGAFDCEIFSEEGTLVVTGAFVMQARRGDPSAAPVPYAFDFSAWRVVLEDDRALVADGWITLPQVPERRLFEHGTPVTPPPGR